MDTSWFVTTLIIECEVDGRPSLPDEWTCSQQIFLIRASSRDVAYGKAIKIGESQETSYLNVNGQLVTWKFVGLENLEELSKKGIRDGTEIWGRIIHTNDPEALVVGKKGLSVYYEEEIKYFKAEDILKNGQETKLICNRIRL